MKKTGLESISPTIKVASEDIRRRRTASSRKAAPVDLSQIWLSVTGEPAPFDNEFVIGLVGALGTNLTSVKQVLSSIYRKQGYHVEEIRLSALLESLPQYKSKARSPLKVRYSSLMDDGDHLREWVGRNDAMALLAIREIRNIRKRLFAEKCGARVLYIVHSLKTPEEAELLRRVYAERFVGVSVYEPFEDRLDSLTDRFWKSAADNNKEQHRADAIMLLNRDKQDQAKANGQNVQGAFPLSDFFLTVGPKKEMKKSLERFSELLFGDTTYTPTQDENAMAIAYVSSLRSSSLARQVGAAICTSEGAVVAVGTNEVPKAGGGQYWYEDEFDDRDIVLEYDANDAFKIQMIQELISSLDKLKLLNIGQRGKAKDVEELLKQIFENKKSEEYKELKRTRSMNLIEFTRSVHAEMAAILDCARRGASLDGCSLYSTTFPCHECTRHIIGAGIQRVVYIEPYPKSLAEDLHSKAILFESEEKVKHKVNFVPFVGIAPRIYLKLFKSNREKNVYGKLLESSSQAFIRNLNYPSFTMIVALREVTEVTNFAVLIAGKSSKVTASSKR